MEASEIAESAALLKSQKVTCNVNGVPSRARCVKHVTEPTFSSQNTILSTMSFRARTYYTLTRVLDEPLLHISSLGGLYFEGGLTNPHGNVILGVFLIHTAGSPPKTTKLPAQRRPSVGKVLPPQNVGGGRKQAADTTSLHTRMTL